MKSAQQWWEEVPGYIEGVTEEEFIQFFGKIQNDALDSAAQVNLDKTGRQWVRESLWDNMSRVFSESVLKLKALP